MRLKEFSHGDITVKYAYLPSKQASRKAMLVVLTNPFEKHGTVEFMHSLIPFDVPRLFVGAAKEYQFGLHLMKDGTLAPRDAIIQLIEKFRTENGVEKHDTYLIGFCMASQPAMAIAVEQGYNMLITEFIYGGTLYRLWNDSDPDKQKFRDHQDEVRGPHMEFSFDYFFERMEDFSGHPDLTKYVAEYLEEVQKTSPHKFSIPKTYFLAGKHEESWRLFGEDTVEKLRGYGMSIEVTISDEQYGHMEAIPHFIAFFSKKLRQLGL